MTVYSWREIILELAQKRILTEEEGKIFVEHKSLMAAFLSRLELEKSTAHYCIISQRPCKKYPFEVAKEAALHVIGAWRVKHKVIPPSERFVDNSTQTYLG